MKIRPLKVAAALILASIIVTVLVGAAAALAYGVPSVGVKEGDWIEYTVSITGKGTPPPTHDVRWFRMEVLQVQGAAFSVNLTARYANGTVGSAIWQFNFTEGHVEGWMIIPANLSPGDTFYDAAAHTGKPVNVTIQRQEEKIVLGARRIVTYGNDSFRHKVWDKATGVFVASSECFKNVTNRAGWYIEDLTVTVQAVATNMWSPELILGLRQAEFYALAAVILLLAAVILTALLVTAKRKNADKPLFSPSWQRNIAVLTILSVTAFEVGSIFFFPFAEIGLSFAQINLLMQTIWTALVLLSMWLRLKGNYFAHEILMLIVMCAWWAGFSMVLLMDPFTASTEAFVSTPLRLLMNSLHAIFSIPALVFGTWLVALWRPASAAFPAKSRRMAQLTTIFWIPSYIVGVIDFMVLHTTIFG
ncbi:MAG: hypothetical protein NWF09_09820 [Candidatus Bathyarchaeota archaeon]|nr:hypothetical protein [Candidatus Bathyarchaeota archaeon]